MQAAAAFLCTSRVLVLHMKTILGNSTTSLHVSQHILKITLHSFCDFVYCRSCQAAVLIWCRAPGSGSRRLYGPPESRTGFLFRVTSFLSNAADEGVFTAMLKMYRSSTLSVSLSHNTCKLAPNQRCLYASLYHKTSILNEGTSLSRVSKAGSRSTETLPLPSSIKNGYTVPVVVS